MNGQVLVMFFVLVLLTPLSYMANVIYSSKFPSFYESRDAQKIYRKNFFITSLISAIMWVWGYYLKDSFSVIVLLQFLLIIIASTIEVWRTMIFYVFPDISEQSFSTYFRSVPNLITVIIVPVTLLVIFLWNYSVTSGSHNILLDVPSAIITAGFGAFLGNLLSVPITNFTNKKSKEEIL